MLEGLGKGLTTAVNVHGFGFQFAALKEAERAFKEKRSPWTLIASEFPVQVSGRATHIDFILQSRHEPFYICVECKRPDPARDLWCFAKAPYTDPYIASHGGKEKLVRETLFNYPKGHGGPHLGLEWLHLTDDVYRLAFEIKSTRPGDGLTAAKGFKDARDQVLRGMNGLVEFVRDQFVGGNHAQFRVLQDEREYCAFLPVIFTTARLFVTNARLSDADLSTGNIEIRDGDIEERPWLWYQYGQSPDLKHNLRTSSGATNLSQLLYFDYTRSIPVVGAAGIDAFLTSDNWKSTVQWNIDK